MISKLLFNTMHDEDTITITVVKYNKFNLWLELTQQRTCNQVPEEFNNKNSYSPVATQHQHQLDVLQDLTTTQIQT